MKYNFNRQTFERIQRENIDLYKDNLSLKTQLEAFIKLGDTDDNGTSTPLGTESSGESGASEVTGRKGNQKKVQQA